jgi:prephenate dehydrogenase
MTEKHNWVTDDLCLIEETTGVKLYGTVCTDISFIAKQLNMANKNIRKLEEKNKELQERNNRQAKQLDDLYRLIEQKDWRALSDIMDDFKKAEEQLQKEWKCYE